MGLISSAADARLASTAVSLFFMAPKQAAINHQGCACDVVAAGRERCQRRDLFRRAEPAQRNIV
ncbi:hypothetical protein D9M68_405190 [compost metagenome]